jgi:transposase
MRAVEFLTEYRPKGVRHKKYQDGGKPDWYEKAVQLKTDNPRMTAVEIGKQVGVNHLSVLYWLAGTPNSDGNISNDNPPFTQKDFPMGPPKTYYDGAKPEWYDQALQMAKADESFTAIGKKFGVTHTTIGQWLVKGRKKQGKLVNPDAELEPRKIRGQKLDVNLINSFIKDGYTDAVNLINSFIKDGYTDADIIELVADEKGVKVASQVKNMLPTLRQKLNPGTQVIDKTRTGSMRDPDITGFIKEKYTGDNWQLLEVDDQFQAPVGDCFEAAYKKLYEVFREHPEAKLVHAIVTGQGPIKGVQHGHAWVEIGDTVLDYSNGRTIEMPKQIYYAVGNVDPNNSKEYKTYSFKEMADISLDQGTYGPWELPQGSL